MITQRGTSVQRWIALSACSLLFVPVLHAADENTKTSPRRPMVAGGVAGGVAGAVESARLQQLQSVVDSKGWLKDPFKYLQSDMVDVIQDLAEGETKFPAEVSEPKIVSRLDVLVEMLEKQCKGGKGGAGGRPLQRSVLAGGPGGQGDLNAPRNNQRKWAELTAKERERILQSKTEGFPAGYEEILGEYFRRLATEDSVRAITPGAAAKPVKADSDKSP